MPSTTPYLKGVVNLPATTGILNYRQRCGTGERLHQGVEGFTCPLHTSGPTLTLLAFLGRLRRHRRRAIRQWYPNASLAGSNRFEARHSHSLCFKHGVHQVNQVGISGPRSRCLRPGHSLLRIGSTKLHGFGTVPHHK